MQPKLEMPLLLSVLCYKGPDSATCMFMSGRKCVFPMNDLSLNGVEILETQFANGSVAKLWFLLNHVTTLQKPGQSGSKCKSARKKIRFLMCFSCS